MELAAAAPARSGAAKPLAQTPCPNSNCVVFSAWCRPEFICPPHRHYNRAARGGRGEPASWVLRWSPGLHPRSCSAAVLSPVLAASTNHFVSAHPTIQVSFYLHQFLTTRVPPHPAVTGGGAGHSTSLSGSGGGRVPSMQQLVGFLSSQRLSSEVQVRTDLYPRALADVPVTHFFGAARPTEHQAGAAAPAQGGSSGSDLEAAAAVLMAAAQHASEGWSGAAARDMRSRPPPAAPLFALLEAAGGGSSSDNGSAQAAAVVAVAWVAAALLAYHIMKGV